MGRDEDQRREAKQDHTAPINRAFEAVERQLDRISELRQQEAMLPAGEGRSGMVVRLFPQQSYGFIEVDNSTELYFTRNAVLGGAFDDIEVGMLVHVTPSEENGPMGPQAKSVRLLDRTKTPA